jgi:NitT/TauT family transport system permease protein
MHEKPFKLIYLWRALPLLVLLLAWQLAAQSDPGFSFFFGSPSKIGSYLVQKTLDGSLARDVYVTLIEAVVGFLVGNVAGTAIGLGLWYSKLAMAISRPYVIALGAAPIFAFAPLLVIWFGTGMFSKIMIATLSTVFVALTQSYTGASEVSEDFLRLMRTFGATRTQTFRKVVAPASIVWVISGFRLNVGFAILGAFIGEFVSSNVGLGHLILVASGLFDISLVFCGVICLCGLALLLNFLVGQLEQPLRRGIVRYL